MPCGEAVVTHVAALKHPAALSILVHLVPVPQTHERAARDITGVPKVEREEDDDNRDLWGGLRSVLVMRMSGIKKQATPVGHDALIAVTGALGPEPPRRRTERT